MIFAIFEPIMFPIANLFCFWIMEIIVATISGSDVPKATIVIPTVVSAIPKISVKFFADDIKNLELKNKAINAISILNISNGTFLFENLFGSNSTSSSSGFFN